MFFALCFAIAESYKKELITTQEPRHYVYDNNFKKIEPLPYFSRYPNLGPMVSCKSGALNLAAK